MALKKRNKTEKNTSDGLLSVKEQQAEKTLTVHIIDEINGVRVIENVRGVRIDDKEVRLFIMSDYAPILGEVNGSVSIFSADGEVELKDLSGFYKLEDNSFTLVVSGNAKNWYKR